METIPRKSADNATVQGQSTGHSKEKGTGKSDALSTRYSLKPVDAPSIFPIDLNNWRQW